MSRAAVSLATTQPRSSRPSTRGRIPCGSRAAYSVCSSMKTKQKAPRSWGRTSSAVASRVRSGSSVSSAVTSAVSVVLPRRSSPPRWPENPSPLRALEPVAQLGGVGEVAVVRERDGARVAAAERRLGVLPGAGAGRGVAAVADREVALERAQAALVEDLGDQAHVLVDQEARAVTGGDARRLLAAVLQRVEAEVGELGDLLAGSPDPEDAAGILRGLLTGDEVMCQSSVAACHVPQSPTPGSGDRPPAGTRRGVRACGRAARRRCRRRAPRARPRRGRGSRPPRPRRSARRHCRTRAASTPSTSPMTPPVSRNAGMFAARRILGGWLTSPR